MKTKKVTCSRFFVEGSIFHDNDTGENFTLAELFTGFMHFIMNEEFKEEYSDYCTPENISWFDLWTLQEISGGSLEEIKER